MDLVKQIYTTPDREDIFLHPKSRNSSDCMGSNKRTGGSYKAPLICRRINSLSVRRYPMNDDI